MSTPTSPTLPVEDRNVLNTQKKFSGAMTLELTDEEIQQAMGIIVSIKNKYEGRQWFSVKQMNDILQEFSDEVVTRLAEIGVVASVDMMPVVSSGGQEGPAIEFVGKVQEGIFGQEGMDHERKEWEVKRADAREEDFYGQKGKHA